MYIWKTKNCPLFKWDTSHILTALSSAKMAQGYIFAQADVINLKDQGELIVNEALTTSSIEGHLLDKNSMRSSVARRLGLPTAGLPEHKGQNDGLVESGKSTMLNLIARFWDIKDGSIIIGGIDVCEMKCNSILENVSAVFQKEYLFHDTVLGNIQFGNPNATREQVMDAARKAHCHEFIMKMDKGYNTVTGENEATLSGGERQRISIARAMLKNAPIILLDEVTANIDAENG